MLEDIKKYILPCEEWGERLLELANSDPSLARKIEMLLLGDDIPPHVFESLKERVMQNSI